MNIIAFTDGSSSRKRQEIGCGFVIYNGVDIVDSFSIGFSECGRNGAAELLAMTICLESLEKYKNEKIVIWSDAEYVTKTINEWVYNWVPMNFVGIKNIEIMIYMLYLVSTFKSLKIKWIKGHQKDDSFESLGNRKADELAGEYKESLYENKYNFNQLLEDLKLLIKEKNMRKIVLNYYNIKEFKIDLC